MNDVRFDEYYKTRYLTQLEWFDNKANDNKNKYQLFQWASIIIAAFLPLLITVLPNDMEIVSISCSVLLVIITTSMKIFRFHENWINYRAISELLKSEGYYFEARVLIYSNEVDVFGTFVRRVESIILDENAKWKKLQQNDMDN